MQGFYTMLKMNLKLLLRNKGYLAALIILPVLSVIMLCLNTSDEMYSQDNTGIIHELSSDDQGLLNITNSTLSIKVYDSSNSKLSEYILQELVKTQTFSVNRYLSGTMELDEVREKALYSANHNVIGAIIYIPENFEEEILSGKESNLILFEAVEDGRVDLLESNINTYLQSLYHYAYATGYNKEELYQLLDTSQANEFSKETVSIEVGDTLNLTIKQKGQSSNIGYSFAFLTISFLFSGIFIASTVIEERQNRVYNRFVLSRASMINYGLVKLAMVFLTVVLETGITAIVIKLLVKTDFGISFVDYILIVFCLGLLFNLLSVVIGLLTNNVLTSNYIAFTLWCFSCMFGGLYFPLDAASKLWSRASMLMPQRWAVKVSEMLMAGKSGVYGMGLLAFLGFLIFIACIGLLGVKIRQKE